MFGSQFESKSKTIKKRSSFKSEIPIFEIPGGIHPDENKLDATDQPIKPLPIAKELIINLKGQAGNRSKPIVGVGDKVLKGQPIAENDGVFSSFQHASTSGTVVAIEKRPIAHASGLEDLSIVLESDGLDHWCSLKPNSDYSKLSREQVLAQIFEAGIVGLGGASFPSHIKLQRETGIKTLIINAAECEPYISCDDQLLQEQAKEVLLGAQIIAHLYKDLTILVGIEDNKPEAIKAIEQARNQLQIESSELKIAVVPTKYPSGGEKQLIQLLTGKEVPKGKLPADLGLVMHNVGTCFAIFEAIVLGKPLVDRVVTISGDSCAQKGNYRIPIGTPINHIALTTESNNYDKLIMGGPMMGFEVHDARAGIVKATNCIIASSDASLGNDEAELPCIRCGACMDACPASLLPQQLYWHAKADEFDKTEEYDLFDCIECGACAYVCPSNIPLVQYYRYAKSSIRNNHIEKLKSDGARERYEARLERLDRVKREKAQKHKKAAEARRIAAEALGKNDPKKAAVAAALARVQAKKLADANSDKNLDEKNKDKKP